MTRRMLINALHKEECRVAVAEDDHLLELEVERLDQSQLKGNIYKAPITRVEPSLQAAFLDIGSNRNGFLQINDINSAYFFDHNDDEETSRPERYRPSIQEVLSQGQDLVVQVVKDERAAKGATLTTNLSIPGRYLVLMVGNQRGGVSRKIQDEGQRRRLKQAVHALKMPSGMGVIVRTAGINKSSAELQRDLDGLLEIWFDILERTSQPSNGPVVLYHESSIAIRTIRDYLTSDVDEIWIDDRETYESVREFVRRVIPQFDSKLFFYDKPQPLFSFYHLDAQVEETNNTEVTLPSGGSIVINSTEAVVAIDVNSGRSTGQADVEDTAYETNKEAAITIAKQLRLRDLGGLIVVDFIDMNDKRHKQIVERTLKDAVRFDKAKIEVGRISKFGLMEMSRQRMKASLVSQSHETCPHCHGRGRVKTAESAALEALRKIQSAVFAGGVSEIRVHMAPAAALMLLNSKRRVLSDFEQQSSTVIRVYADGRMRPEEYQLEVLRARNEAPVIVRATSQRPTEQRRDDERGSGDRRRNDRPPREGSEGGRSNEGGRPNEGGGGRRRNNNRRRNSRGGQNRRRGGGHHQNRGERPAGEDRENGAGREGPSAESSERPQHAAPPPRSDVVE